MTDKLQEILQRHLSALDCEAPDYPLLVKCYQALKAVFIPPEVEKCMVEWADEAGDSSNLPMAVLNCWRRNGSGSAILYAPAVALDFVQAFYYDYRLLQLTVRVETDHFNYIDSLRGMDIDTVITSAHEIDVKKQIMEFLTDDDEQAKLDIEDIDLLLTLEHPVAQLYEVCHAQDAIREAVEYSLDRVTQRQKSFLQTAPDMGNEDINIYRARYLSDRVEVPFPAVSQMCEQLIARAEQEQAAAIDGPPLPPEHVVRLHNIITFFREQGYTPEEAVVMLTYDHPFAEVLDRMEQSGLLVEFAFSCAVADRQAEMQQYIDRLDSLPAPLQKLVREYQERLATVEIFCAAAPENEQDQDWEAEER